MKVFICKNGETECGKCKTKEKTVSRAKEISEQYGQLEKCCGVISSVQKSEDIVGMSMYTGGWRLSGYSVKGAGIDIEDVYNYIEKLARKRKSELEIELEKLEA
jgi:purine-nucleoside phosphorylase